MLLKTWYSFTFQNNENIEFHVSPDSSKDPYGAVTYFRCVDHDIAKVNFFVSQSRLIRESQQSTILRLELQTGVTATKLKKAVVNDISIFTPNRSLGTNSY